MTKTTILIVLTAMLIPTLAQSQAARSRSLNVRFFVAEVPPADQGGTVQVGVNLPRGARIARTLVEVADTNLGADRRGWSRCDNETRACDMADTSIIRFHRNNVENAQELAADIRNTSNETRYAKVTVTFQPVSGRDRTGCGRAAECGFSRAASAD